jgi:hypothetical protein
VDAAAIQQAFEMPAQPLSDLPDLDLSAVTERQINELISNNTEGTRVVSAYSSSSSSSSTSSLDSGSDDDDDDEEPLPQAQQSEEVNPVVGVKRRPSTTEAKKRVPLDDGDEDAEGQSQRPQVTRMVSDPFESPVESSEDSSEDSGEELSFGR